MFVVKQLEYETAGVANSTLIYIAFCYIGVGAYP